MFNGERRQTVVDMPDLPTDLPDGWPYGAVEQMIVLRRPSAAATTTRSPTTTVRGAGDDGDGPVARPRADATGRTRPN